jgi:TPR repeat protein
VVKDEQKAFEWAKKAADQGYAEAEALMSAYYTDGNGCFKDEQKAFEWAKKAADHGDDNAKCILMALYMEGEHKDIKECYKLANELSLVKNVAMSDAAKKLSAQLESSPEVMNLMSQKVSANIVDSIKDSELGKFGGPDTGTVIKFVTGQGSGNGSVNMLAGYTTQLGQARGLKYKEIKRGPTLKSLGPTIPVNTILYPIRILEDANGMEQTVDFYFYKDEFGDWKATLK